MGLVRLMRAGSMHFCAAAMRQLPAEEEPQLFAAAAQQLSDPSDAHMAAAHTLDDTLAQLRTHASAGALPATMKAAFLWLLMQFTVPPTETVILCKGYAKYTMVLSAPSATSFLTVLA